MYGLLIVGVQHFIETYYGQHIWPLVVARAGLTTLDYQTQKIYSETVIERLMVALSQETGRNVEDLLYQNGLSFAAFTADYGYEKLLRVQGRSFIHLLRNLDNLHEHLRFSYPKIRPPSFFTVTETVDSIKLVYSSKRVGYEHYVRGQLINLAKRFFNLNITVTLISRWMEGLVHHVMYEITHDGRTWGLPGGDYTQTTLPTWSPTLHSDDFFSIVSFFILITPSMIIQRASESFNQFDNELEGSVFSEKFLIGRPYTNANFEEIKLHRHNTFELVLVSDANLQSDRGKKSNASTCFCSKILQICSEPLTWFGAELGRMCFTKLRDTKQLADCGLYISDLNLFDRSRDIILSGDQQSDELMKLFKKQLEESKQLEKSMKRVEKMRKITDELLYQCIPKGVAQKLRSGTPALETIQTFESVSVCFTKVVNFGAKCMQISVEEVIQLLNNMYTIFDALTESHKVYKVETIGDSYMLVSGAPQRTPMHAAHITEMAMEMIVATQHGLSWPHTAQQNTNERRHSLAEHVQLFVGCNTGPIVAGVVGYKTPRYCLFGDTVNTASRMMSTGVPDKIHVSNSFAEALSKYPYILELRGKTVVKGKGEMETYFVCGHDQNFTFVDEVSGERRRFDEVLKEDFQCSCHTPTESSLSHGSASVDLTDEASEDERKGDAFDSACITPTRKDSGEADGTLVRKIKVPLLQLQKAQSTDRTEAKVEGIAIDSTTDEVQSNGAAFGRTRKIGLVGLNAEQMSRINPHQGVANTETTKVLNGVAHKLLISKSNEVRQKKVVRLPEVTFSAATPSEIPNNPYEAEVSRSENESDARLTDPSEDPNGSPHSGSIKTRSCIIPNGTEGRKLNCTPPPSPRNSANKSYGNGLGSTIRTEEDKKLFRNMVKEKRFGFMPLVPLRSPQAAILREVAEPLSLGWTELMIVRPHDPIAYLGRWLHEYAATQKRND
ncbi:hypothetical protein CRM22_007801 [Opisthorchis felineus]|uniref:guanylate cyclase n=1 Tax=Opisthorchis felineus TaxID=147828 RepID=A0A4S2LM39_OPIFE|nr:hypothetical protein CRM22_007801 [Opisthorchis felineus]